MHRGFPGKDGTMAMMIDCGMDWTLDLAYEDARKATALPMMRGVTRRCENDGVWFFTQLKTAVKFAPKTTTPWDDAWEQNIDWGWASDVYKDIYGQRPHFSDWHWRGLLGVYQPMVDFCSPMETMERDCEAVRYIREQLIGA